VTDAGVVEGAAATSRTHSRIPGDLLLHPVGLVTIVAVVVNDQLLKRTWPGLVSGKLSDFAGLVYFPLLLVALAEVGRRIALGTRWPLTPRAVVNATLVVGAAFVLIKTCSPAADAYRAIMGVLLWPGHALLELMGSRSIPPVRPVLLVEDPTDLVALVVLPVPISVARRVMA
jgi:hypothetical protein